MTYINNEAGNDYDSNFDELIATVDLKEYGLAIRSSNIDAGTVDYLSYDSKGLPSDGTGGIGNGTIVLEKDATRAKNIKINVAGNIRVE